MDTSLKKLISAFFILLLIVVIPLTVVLVQKRQELRSKASGDGDANPKIAGLVLPSVLGFQADLFSGASSISYPISVPSGPGGTKPNISLSYSTSSVDDMHTSVPDWSGKYVTQAQLAGLGWNLGGVDSITKGSRGQYYISVSGSSYKLISNSYAPDNTPLSEIWETSPKGFLRIRHNVGNFGQYPWEVTGKDGTKYYFGENEESRAWTVEVPNPEHPTERKDVMYRWMLNKIIDTHGNTIEYTYTKETKILGGYPYCKIGGQPYVRAILPSNIKWSNGHNNVEFIWEEREDWNFDGTDKDCTQTTYTTKRLKEILVKVDNQLVRKYSLAYRYPQTGIKHSLLTSITQLGRDGTTSLPPYTFDYEGTSNETYLKWANNGYGGKVTFTYTRNKPQTIGRTGEDRSTYNGTERTRVIKKVTEDGMGNTIVNRTMYAGDRADKEGKVAPPPEPYDPNDGYTGIAYLDANLADAEGDFEFLGFSYAKDILYEKNKDGNSSDDIVNITKKYFHQKDTVDQTVNGQTKTFHFPDPRKGKSYKTEIQDKTGKILTTSEENWKYDVKPHFNEVDGKPDIAYFPLVTLESSQNTIDGKTVKTSYTYDQYANMKQTIEEGDISKSGDERFSEVEYLYNTTDWIINKPKIAKLFKGLPNSNPEEINRTLFSYDNLSFGSPPVNGNVTKTEKIGLKPEEIRVITTTKYDKFGNPTEASDAKGNITKTEYDQIYHVFPVKIINPLNQSTSTHYDYILGVPNKVSDINSIETNFEYDSLGRAKKIIKAGDSQEKPTTEYFFKDQAPMVVSTKNRIEVGGNDTIDTHQIYNGLGQIVQSQNPGPEQGQIIVSNTIYNSRGAVSEQPIPYFLPHQEIPNPVFGEYQRPLNAKKSVNEYDPLGRIIKVINLDGTSNTFNYKGFETTTINEAGVKKIIEKDAYGNPLKTAEFNQSNDIPYSTVQYEHDVATNLLVKTIDAKGNIISINYDGFGRKVAVTDPDLGRWQYKYDLNGNLTEQTDSKNQMIKFEYDSLNRLTNKIYPDQTKVTYFYDEGQFGKGKQTKMVDSSGSTQTEYDNRGRITKVIKSITVNNKSNTLITYYTYDNLDRIKSYKLPDGEEVQISYNRSGQPLTLKANGQTLVSNTAYNALGMVKKQDYGNNTSSEYAYNESLRLESIKTSNIFHKKYSYDPIGNITKIEDMLKSSETENYAYDNLNRLITANGPYSAKYEYDEIGNILFKQEGNDTKTLTYNNVAPVHAPKAVNNAAYQYDTNGNLTKDELRQITYDYDNRPISMVLGEQSTQTPAPTSGTTTPPANSISLNKGTNKITWTNDFPQNKQFSTLSDNCSTISERENNFWSVYVKNYTQTQDNFLTNHNYYIHCKNNASINSSLFSFPQVFAQSTPNKTIEVKFIYDGNSNRVAKIEGNNIALYLGDFEKNLETGETTKYYSLGGKKVAVNKASDIEYLVTDHLGSVRNNGTNYYPYGKIRTGDNLPSRQYTGQINDTETDLYFYNARYYNPANGNFIQPDAINPNRFNYATNNPINLNDPSGNEPEGPELPVIILGEEENNCDALCMVIIGFSEFIEMGQNFKDIIDNYFRSGIEEQANIYSNINAIKQENYSTYEEYMVALSEAMEPLMYQVAIASVGGDTKIINDTFRIIETSKHFNSSIAPWYKKAVDALIKGNPREAIRLTLEGTGAKLGDNPNIPRGTYLKQEFNPYTKQYQWNRYLNVGIKGSPTTEEALGVLHTGKSMQLINTGCRSPYCINYQGQAWTSPAKYAGAEKGAVDELLYLDGWTGSALSAVGNYAGAAVAQQYYTRLFR